MDSFNFLINIFSYLKLLFEMLIMGVYGYQLCVYQVSLSSFSRKQEKRLFEKQLSTFWFDTREVGACSVSFPMPL